MTFNDILKYLQSHDGCKRISSDNIIFRQIETEIPKMIIPSMKSLPKGIKDLLLKRIEEDRVKLNGVKYQNQFCSISPDNVITYWTPTGDDLIADDWIIVC